MSESVFDELKRYVGFSEKDAAALRALHPHAAPHFQRIATLFYDRILQHDEARRALEGGESSVGRLKVTLVAWMDSLLQGPWDEAYYERRARIGRVHVRIALPQHYMFGAMNVLRGELERLIDESYLRAPEQLFASQAALGKILDLELAIMLHTYREDLLAQQSRVERLATFGQLVGSIGHELRNPLGVIESSLYILRSHPSSPTDERSTKHLQRISEQVGVANDIVTQLLDMIRDRPLTTTRVALKDVFAAATRTLTLPPGVSVQSEGLDTLPPLRADAGQLRQVLLNLLENAVHATGPSGGWVKVRASEAEGTVRLEVQDSGPGVDPSIRGRLFEPLVTRKVKGIGLGLALVKRIVERHGGTIAYEPPAEGGARFVVRLPTGGAA